MPSCHITWQLYQPNGNENICAKSAINDPLICVVTSVRYDMSGVLFVIQLINW